jgi:hypothetical protein
VVVACSKIRIVRRVLKQLPVEMLQQWPSASRCRCTLSRSTKPYVSIPHLLFWMALYSLLVFRNTLLTLLWPLIAWIPPSAFLSCPRKQLPSAFWQMFI